MHTSTATPLSSISFWSSSLPFIGSFGAVFLKLGAEQYEGRTGLACSATINKRARLLLAGFGVLHDGRFCKVN